MPLENNEHEYNASDARQNKPSEEGSKAAPQMTPTASHPNPPQSPSDGDAPTKEPSKWRENTKLGLEIAGLLVLVVYTVFSALQWLQIRYTNKLTARALDGNDKTLGETLKKSQGQIDATNRLGDYASQQVGKLDSSIQQASRLATDTETANANVIEADRPWLGGVISVTNFEVGKTPIFTFSFPNSGKRPGRVEKAITAGIISEVFPNMEKEFSHSPSASRAIIVPGQAFVSIRTTDKPLTKENLDVLDSGKMRYYACAKISYIDLVTMKVHWTHICSEYVPHSENNETERFVNCPSYNDAN